MIIPQDLRKIEIFELLLVSFSALAFIFLYNFTLSYYFQQDDFFFLLISKATNVEDILSFFAVGEGLIAYRPLSERMYYFAIQSLFGLNPIVFRLINFLLTLGSFLLIIKVVTILTKNRLTGILAACFWLTASFHFMAISWIAASYNIVGTFFYLLTSFYFLYYIYSSKKRYYFFSFFFFLLTLASFEFSITWPGLFLFYYLFNVKKSLKGTLIFVPYIILALLYLLVKVTFTKIPQIPEYTIAINIDSVKAFFWYILWSLNIPDEFKYQISRMLIVLRSDFLHEFWPLAFKSYTLLLWIITLGLVVPFYRCIKKQIHLDLRVLIFSTVFFIFTISPTLLLPNHTYIMYLTLSSIGIYTFIAHMISQNNSKLLVCAVLGIWIISSQITLNFYKNSSWVVNSQKTAKSTVMNTLLQYPTIPKGATIYYPLLFKREEQSLGGANALKALYNDNTLKVYYFYADLLKDFRDEKINGGVYVITPMQ